jgi:hypothetical protein
VTPDAGTTAWIFAVSAKVCALITGGIGTHSSSFPHLKTTENKMKILPLKILFQRGFLLLQAAPSAYNNVDSL